MLKTRNRTCIQTVCACTESQESDAELLLLFYNWEETPCPAAVVDLAKISTDVLIIQLGWAPAQFLPTNDPWFPPHCLQYTKQLLHILLRTPSRHCLLQISLPHSRRRVLSWSLRSAPTTNQSCQDQHCSLLMLTWESLQEIIQRYLQLGAKHWSRGFHYRYSIREVSQVYPMDSKRKGNSLGSDSRGKDLRQQKARHWTCSQRERQHISAPDNHPNSSGYFLTLSCQP